MRRWIVVATLVLASVTLSADYLEVRRQVTLKADPDRDAEVVETLAPDTQLELLDDQQTNGYYRARIPESGLDGWVYRSFVRRIRGTIPVAATSTRRPAAAASSVVWARFDRDFVRNRYPNDLAFTSLTFDTQWVASAKHGVSCGGKDGEIHIGAYERHIEFASGEQPFARMADEPTVAWGIVAEPPNATSDDSAALEDLEGTHVSFTGYLRVWNEGHYDDEPAEKPQGSSNPNHLVELHPTWFMNAEDEGFEEYDFQPLPIQKYAGYGLTKAGPMLRAVAGGEWPKAYVTNTSVFVSLSHESNFYQIPIRISSVQATSGGILMRADVCEQLGCVGGQILYRNLRLVTRSDSAEGTPFAAGQVVEVLGLFSVHLGRVARIASNATTRPGAVAVGDALEFFVFNRAKRGAVKNSKCEPESTS
jgi:hypothetical protein